MIQPSHARLLPGLPPEHLDDTIFHTPFLQVARDAALIHLPDGSRLHWSRALGGVQHALSPGQDARSIEPILHQTVFAITAWLDGLLPLPSPGILCGDELFILSSYEADFATLLTAMLAERLGQGTRVTGSMVALTPEGTARLSGSALSAQRNQTLAMRADCDPRPIRPGVDRVWLSLEAAPTSARPKAVTVVAVAHGTGNGHHATPQDAQGCAAFLGGVAMLPELGLALHGKAGLSDLLGRIGAAVMLLMITADHPSQRPDTLADLLAKGMQAA